jgi:mycothiol synthase
VSLQGSGEGRLIRTLPGVSDEVEIQTLHEPAETDVRGLEALVELTTRHDGHRPIGEHALIELQAGPREFPHLSLVARQGDALVGWAHLSKRETRLGWRFEAFVSPDHRARGIGGRLVSGVLAHVAREGGGRVHFWAYDPGPAHMKIVMHHGMKLARRISRMHRTLPAGRAQAREGVELRPFRVGRDEAAWLDAHNEVFADHPDEGNWREQDLAWHLEEPWFDPEGFILAVDDEGVAGYCWMKPEGSVAWLYILGVRPRARGRGLGRALAAAGLSWAASKGAHMCQLYADSSDEPALAVYRALGFTQDHVDECYELMVPPG